MNKYPIKALAAAAAIMAAPLALAHGPQVSWSVSVGSAYPAPRVYGPPPVVYVQPQPVYVQPQTVYVAPQPVYYGQPYYVEEVRYRKFKHRHWKHHSRFDD